MRKSLSTSRDSEIIEIGSKTKRSPHTRGCYRLDSKRLLEYVGKPLPRITRADLQGFAQSLTEEGLAPISCARTLAAAKSLFGFANRLRLPPANPAAELALHIY
jgi:site-specific recombinase XerD